MASFNWATCVIDMTANSGRYGGTRADLARIPSDPAATMSFAHEYVHFLQLISSVPGIRILGELLDLGINGAFALAGHQEGTIPPRTAIIPLLKTFSDGQGQKLPWVADRTRHLMEQVRVLFFPTEHPYTGTKGPWDCDEQTVTDGQCTEPLYGFVTPRHTFRPFSPGMLAEGIARRTDQWLKTNMGFTGHSWGSGDDEREFYNGVREVLSRPRYGNNVAAVNVDRLTVVMCWLALATVRPDWAMRTMLDRLERTETAGGTVEAIAHILKEELLRSKYDACHPRAHAYNQIITALQKEAPSAMEHGERYAVVAQLQNIGQASNVVLSDPAYYADERINWQWIKLWMTQHTVPPVVVTDGAVDQIDGVPCTSTVTELLRQIWRVMV